MSRKGSSSNTIGLLAFVALLLSAICMIICAINSTGLLTIGGQIPSILQLISYVCLIIVVILAGWSYAASLSKTWRIIYIVIAVIAILGALGFVNFKIV